MNNSEPCAKGGMEESNKSGGAIDDCVVQGILIGATGCDEAPAYLHTSCTLTSVMKDVRGGRGEGVIVC